MADDDQSKQTGEEAKEEAKGPPGGEYGQEKENPNASKKFSMDVPKEKSYEMVVPSQDLKEYQYNSDEMLDSDHAALYANLPKIAAADQKQQEEEEAQANTVADAINELEKSLMGEFKQIANRARNDNLGQYFIPPTQQGKTTSQTPKRSTSTSSSQSQTQTSFSGNYDDRIVRSSDSSFLYYSNDRTKLHRLEEQDEYIRLSKDTYTIPKYVPKPSKEAEEQKVHPLFKHPSTYKIKIAIIVIVSLLALLLLTCLIYIAILFLKKK